MPGDGEVAVDATGAGAWAAAGAACTSVIGVGSELLWEAALLEAVTDPGVFAVSLPEAVTDPGVFKVSLPEAAADAVVFTGSAAAMRKSCAEDTTALVNETAHAQMSFLVGVDIGLRQRCVDCGLVKAGTRPAPAAFLANGSLLRSQEAR